MGPTEGTPADTPLLRRGDHLSPGPTVPRRFPEILADSDPSPIPDGHSGRLELARWLTRPDHPLTARVAVNRMWRWHFGRGLVASVDNFGLLGGDPSHPALLDWLAQRFVESGWSMKAMHRLMMLTNAYQRAGDVRSSEFAIRSDNRVAAVLGGAGSVRRIPHSELPDPHLKDSENALLWRFSPRRLEAEEIRDSLLAVSGRIDRTAGGPAVTHVKNREFIFNHTSKDETTYNPVRRTIYLPVVRNNLYDVLQLFDATDAAVLSGDRPTTTVATQSLFWLNSPVLYESAGTIAGNLLSATSLDDAGRVRELIRTAYGRPANDTEVSRYTAAVDSFAADFAASEPDPTARRRKAWAAVAHVVLAGNEFVYIR